MRLSERGFGGFEAIFTLSLSAERRRIGPDPDSIGVSLGLETSRIEGTVLWRVAFRVDVYDQAHSPESADRDVFGVQAAYAVALAPDVDLESEADLVRVLWPHARADLLAHVPPVGGRGLNLPTELDSSALEEAPNVAAAGQADQGT
jgi:hypothetical protein